MATSLAEQANAQHSPVAQPPLLPEKEGEGKHNKLDSARSPEYQGALANLVRDALARAEAARSEGRAGSNG